MLRDQRGFTLVEVLAAMLILIAGVLGTVALIDGANASTSLTKARVGATNLARELAETARGSDYDMLATATIAGALQAKPGLADSDAATSGWQIKRRGITYTVVASGCIYDDQSDKTASHDATFCSNSATSPTGDTNPDDYRRVTFDVQWSSRGKPGAVSQSALIINPSGGLGPRINAFGGPTSLTVETQTSLDYSVTSTAAESLRWSADDGISDGNATGGPGPAATPWLFTWQLGARGAWACPNTPSWLVDGVYVLTAQAFDSRGIPGDLKSKTVTVDRSAPAPPCGLDGGRNGTVFDLEWLPNPERDITGYEVYRRKIAGEPADPIVCSLTTKTACFDSNPLPVGTPVTYYVVAADGTRRGQSADKSFPQAANAAPAPPGQVTANIVDGQPVLNWTAATDSDGTIRFYRVYRDATTLDKRYGATSGPQLSFTDKGATGHQYWITAVDDKFAESVPVGPVTP